VFNEKKRLTHSALKFLKEFLRYTFMCASLMVYSQSLFAINPVTIVSGAAKAIKNKETIKAQATKAKDTVVKSSKPAQGAVNSVYKTYKKGLNTQKKRAQQKVEGDKIKSENVGEEPIDSEGLAPSETGGDEDPDADTDAEEEVSCGGVKELWKEGYKGCKIRDYSFEALGYIQSAREDLYEGYCMSDLYSSTMSAATANADQAAGNVINSNLAASAHKLNSSANKAQFASIHASKCTKLISEAVRILKKVECFNTDALKTFNKKANECSENAAATALSANGTTEAAANINNLSELNTESGSESGTESGSESGSEPGAESGSESGSGSAPSLNAAANSATPPYKPQTQISEAPKTKNCFSFQNTKSKLCTAAVTGLGLLGLSQLTKANSKKKKRKKKKKSKKKLKKSKRGTASESSQVESKKERIRKLRLKRQQLED